MALSQGTLRRLILRAQQEVAVGMNVNKTTPGTGRCLHSISCSVCLPGRSSIGAGRRASGMRDDKAASAGLGDMQ